MQPANVRTIDRWTRDSMRIWRKSSSRIGGLIRRTGKSTMPGDRRGADRICRNCEAVGTFSIKNSTDFSTLRRDGNGTRGASSDPCAIRSDFRNTITTKYLVPAIVRRWELCRESMSPISELLRGLKCGARYLVIVFWFTMTRWDSVVWLDLLNRNIQSPLIVCPIPLRGLKSNFPDESKDHSMSTLATTKDKIA